MRLAKLKAKKTDSLKLVNTTPPGSNANKFFDSLDHTWLNKESYLRKADAHKYQSAQYSQLNSVTYPGNTGVSPNYGGTAGGGGGVPFGHGGAPMSAGDLYNQGWQATREACPNCGAGMLVQQNAAIYWCSTCCQKYTSEGLYESKKRKVETVLEWLDRQVSKYTRKK